MPSTKATRVKLGAKQANLRALDRRDTSVDVVLREEVRTSMADKRPSIPIDQVFNRARAAIVRRVKAAAGGA